MFTRNPDEISNILFEKSIYRHMFIIREKNIRDNPLTIATAMNRTIDNSIK